MLVEFAFDGERYAISETALGSDNRLLRFRSNDRDSAYTLFEAELPTRQGRGVTEGYAWAPSL